MAAASRNREYGSHPGRLQVTREQERRAAAGQTFRAIGLIINVCLDEPTQTRLQRRLVLAQQCFYQSGQGLKEDGCEELAPQVERAPVDQDLTFVRLFTESRESSGAPAHVVVKKDSHGGDPCRQGPREMARLTRCIESRRG